MDTKEPDGKRRALLAQNMAKVRIGRKDGQFVQYGTVHRCLHRCAGGVVARFEVISDLRILNLLEASGPEGCGRKEWPDLEEREVVFAKNQQGISKELFGARSEGIETPALLEDGGNFCNMHKAELPGRWLQYVEADRARCIAGFDDDQS
jgi:hypothetical protein